MMKRLGYFAVSIFMILIFAACEKCEIANNSRKMELLSTNKMEFLENDFTTDFKSIEEFRSFIRDSVLKVDLIVENDMTGADLKSFFGFEIGNHDVTNHANTVFRMELIFFGNRKVMYWNRDDNSI
jgi:hypothetical protein